MTIILPGQVYIVMKKLLRISAKTSKRSALLVQAISPDTSRYHRLLLAIANWPIGK